MRNEETKKRRDEEKKCEGDVHGEGKGWRRAIQSDNDDDDDDVLVSIRHIIESRNSWMIQEDDDPRINVPCTAHRQNQK